MSILKLKPAGKKYPILQMQFSPDEKNLSSLAFRIARLLQIANCAILILIAAGSDNLKDFSAEISPAKNVFAAQKNILLKIKIKKIRENFF